MSVRARLDRLNLRAIVLALAVATLAAWLVGFGIGLVVRIAFLR